MVREGPPTPQGSACPADRGVPFGRAGLGGGGAGAGLEPDMDQAGAIMIYMQAAQSQGLL